MMNDQNYYGRSDETDADDDDGFCLTCHGRGGTLTYQDPVGDGIGRECFLNPCPDCLGSQRCPWCASEVDDDYRCMTDDCGWYPERIGEEVDDPIDYEDWPL